MRRQKGMEGGIIAAGLGSRFQKVGFETPKPLIRLGDRPLISWTLAEFADAGINRVHIIFRKAICEECTVFVKREFPRISFTFICKDTESSAESFLTLLDSWGRDRRILVTTVDSVYRPGMLKRFRDFAEKGARKDLYLGVTDYIEDEKPLYARMAGNGRIISLGGGRSDFVTSGAYLLPSGLARGRDVKAYTALRVLLKELASSMRGTWGVNLGKVLDVDRPQDLISAEKFVSDSA
jgi:NDP-sugar pyrophosphorylase family protein